MMKAGDIFKDKQKEVSEEVKDLGVENKGKVKNIVRSLSNPKTRGGKRKTRRRTTRKRKNQKYMK